MNATYLLIPTLAFTFTALFGCAQAKDALDQSLQPSTSDISAPTAGTAIGTTVVDAHEVDITWGAGSDDVSSASALEYKVVHAVDPTLIDTVAKADAITGNEIKMDWTANASSFHIGSLTGGIDHAFAVLVRDGAGNESLYTPVSVSVPFRMFHIAAMVTGAFGGPSGGDTLCANDSSKPATGTFKAMVVDGSTRVACTSANCTSGGVSENVDWVLNPGSDYARVDGTPIGTTNSSAVFTFPLSNSVYGSSGAYWAGFNADWTTSANTCGGWTTLSAVTGTRGNRGATDSTAISNGASVCGPTLGIICVEQ